YLNSPGRPRRHVLHDSYLAYNAIKKLSTARIFRTAEKAHDVILLDQFFEARFRLGDQEQKPPQRNASTDEVSAE
ncbi:MAG: hypothetical protein M1294_13990, partial [Firmicutes bacterium]|nr:hypothetical protein [Bacillota bacterium]